MSVTINDKPVNGGALSRLMSIVKSVFWPKDKVEEARMVTLGEAAMADLSTDIEADKTSDEKAATPKAVWDAIEALKQANGLV